MWCQPATLRVLPLSLWPLSRETPQISGLGFSCYLRFAAISHRARDIVIYPGPLASALIFFLPPSHPALRGVDPTETLRAAVLLVLWVLSPILLTAWTPPLHRDSSGGRGRGISPHWEIVARLVARRVAVALVYYWHIL